MASPTPSPTDFQTAVYSRDSAGDIFGAKLITVLHNFYHYSDKDFDASNAEYWKSVLGFLLAIIALGIVMMIFMWFSVCFTSCKCCRNCCRCPQFTRKGGIRTVSVMFMMAAAVATVAYYGRNEFISATKDARDTLNELSDAFYDLEADIDDLAASVVSLNETLAAVSCSTDTVEDELSDELEEYTEAVDDMSDYVGGISKQIDKAVDFIKDEATKYIDYGCAFIVGMLWVLCFLGTVAIYTPCQLDNCLVIFVGSLILIGLIFMVAVQVMFSVTFADFCYEGPDNAILSLAEDVNLGDRPIELITYYTKCEGTNPLESEFDSALDSLETFNETLATATDVDPSCVNLDPLYPLLDQAFEVMDDFFELLGCKVINLLYTTVFYDILCDEFIRGLTILWVIQSAAGLLIYMNFLLFPCASNPKHKQEWWEKEDEEFNADFYSNK